MLLAPRRMSTDGLLAPAQSLPWSHLEVSMKRAITILGVLATTLGLVPQSARALPAVQNPSLQSVDWMTIQSPAGLPEVHFHLHWVNPDAANPSAPVSGSAMSQPFGVFMGDAGLIGNFDVPPIAVGSFFDVFFDVPLQNLPPSAQKIVPGGPPPGSPCPPDDHWDGNVDVTFGGPVGQGQSTWHQGKVLVCPGGGKSLIHVVTGCTFATGSPWTMSPLCTGFSATLLEEDKVTPAPNPLPPGWHGYLAISAAPGTIPGTVCCFTVQFSCGGVASLIYVCATACDCNGHTPTLEGFDWNPVHNAAGGRDIRFHMHFHNNDPQGPSMPASGDVFPQDFGVFLPDASQNPIGHFDVPGLAADSFFDVFFDVAANQLPPNPPQQLPGGGPNPNDPCPPDTNFIGNVDVHFANPLGVPPSKWHNGQLLVYPGAGNSYIHMTTDCPDAVGATWTISGLCPGFSATLVENDRVTLAPDPIPSGWSGFIQVSATAAVPPGTTCCFDILFDCGGVQNKIHVCVTTCDWSTALPHLAAVDWSNIGTGSTVHFHLRFQNDNPAGPTNAISGNMMSQPFGAFVPDAGPIGNFSIPSLPAGSFFDVFFDVPRASLPPNPTKVLPGSSEAQIAIAQQPQPCPPDTAWQGNVDIQWHDPAGGAGQGQANYHFGQLLVGPGVGYSYIHLITNCLATTGGSWSFAGLCPGFSATLYNEDRVTPAPLVLPPGWTGWIAVSATGAVPVGTVCCFRLEINCGGAHATVRVCATVCSLGSSNAVENSTVDLGFGIRATTPNPSLGSMVVRFALPEAGDARLEIFSASGQHVRTLANGAFNAGPHFVIWDGRGDAGQKLPPGTYFARLRMGIRSDSRKVTLIQ
jgi:hypothetical protein